jgi:hypothetical protein
MLITVLTEDDRKIPIGISFDLYGNLYFDFDGINNHEYFTTTLPFSSLQINIDGRNRLVGDEGDYAIVRPYENRLSKFQLADEHSMLQKKIKRDLELNGDNGDVEKYGYDVFDENEDDEDMLDPEDEILKHFPERAEFFMTETVDSDHMIDEDLINAYGHYNVKFCFSHLSSDVNVPIYDRENGDVTSLYDTYVYQDGMLCFQSSSRDDESIYTIKIHDDGIIYLRPNGAYEQRYKIIISKDGKLSFIK